MDGKTSLERLRRQCAHLRVEGARRRNHGGRSWGPFSVRKFVKIEKSTIWEKHEKSAPKKMKNHTEKVSKWSRDDTKTNGNSIQKQVTGNIMKTIKNYISLKDKIIEIHCKSNVFDGSEGCMCERYGYQKTSKNKKKNPFPNS